MAINYLNTLLTGYGEDALTNQFVVDFNPVNILGPSASYQTDLSVRTLTCSIPAQTIGTYEITKRGRKFSRPSGVSEQSYEFSFTYRIDKNWKTYAFISDWMKVIQNPITMVATGDAALINAIRDTITVKAMDSLEKTKATWIMEGAYPVEQDAIDFDEESGDPLVISVTMHCINIKYPLMASINTEVVPSQTPTNP